MIGNTVEKTVEKVMDHTYKAASDYIGEDGLLYCGMCKTRKERRITFHSRIESTREVSMIMHYIPRCLKASYTRTVPVKPEKVQISPES